MWNKDKKENKEGDWGNICQTHCSSGLSVNILGEVKSS